MTEVDRKGIRSHRKDSTHLVIREILYLHLIALSSLGRGRAGATLGAGVLEKAAGLTCLCTLPHELSAEFGNQPGAVGQTGAQTPDRSVTSMGALDALMHFFSTRREISHSHFCLLSPSPTPSLPASPSIFARFSIFGICV